METSNVSTCAVHPVRPHQNRVPELRTAELPVKITGKPSAVQDAPESVRYIPVCSVCRARLSSSQSRLHYRWRKERHTADDELFRTAIYLIISDIFMSLRQAYGPTGAQGALVFDYVVTRRARTAFVTPK
ncbi:hypothetical protein DPEC_G00098000 [Dallia pectoralis]|uniref:Uncharacterized protein n=1 Tax=Dallia pectoralis TaxID=75939 RepID=A0ACC2GWG3_DALPE|nr:hypothetical protein DPEC_G00098000 [Dallia pectoralis]